ncbi:hypothetical protein [Sinomonas atrocyanea]
MTETTRTVRLPDHLRPVTSPRARAAAVVRGPHYRITVLTSRLLRLEYSPDGDFEDRASQTVLHRDLEPPEFRVLESEGRLEILTEHLHLVYDRGEFAPHGLSVKVLGGVSNYHSVWHYGEEGERNLGGTARTLDGVDGACALEPGLMSRYGFSVLDDSSTLVFDDDGWLAPGPARAPTATPEDGWTSTSSATGATTEPACATSTGSPVPPRSCRASPSGTGGAGTTGTPRRSTGA